MYVDWWYLLQYFPVLPILKNSLAEIDRKIFASINHKRIFYYYFCLCLVTQVCNASQYFVEERCNIDLTSKMLKNIENLARKVMFQKHTDILMYHLINFQFSWFWEQRRGQSCCVQCKVVYREVSHLSSLSHSPAPSSALLSLISWHAACSYQGAVWEQQ